MTSPLLELEHVSKRFGQVVVADDLSLTVGQGDTVGIVGPNGAGKTSLFGLISGDLAPGAGEIRFAGKSIVRKGPEATARLVAALQVIAHEPDVVQRFATLGIDSVGTTQAQAIASIRKDIPIYSKIVDMAGVRLK